MTLALVLCRECCKGDAEMEPISIPASWAWCFQRPKKSGCQILGYFHQGHKFFCNANNDHNARDTYDAHNAHGTCDTHITSIILWAYIILQIFRLNVLLLGQKNNH